MMDQNENPASTSGGGREKAFDDQPLASEPVGGYFIESLMSARDALELLKLHLVDSGEGSTAIRRVAHSLSASAATFGFPEIVRVATVVQQAENARLADSVTELIDLLGALVEEEPSHTVRILIVESDPDLADLLFFTLSTPNRTISIARTAAEAARMLENEQVSLIVLDLDLDVASTYDVPGGDGATAGPIEGPSLELESTSGDGAGFDVERPETDSPAGQDVLLWLRSRSRTAFIPTIVLSGEDSAALKLECLALGADAFFAKPFDPAELSSMVAVRLQRRAFIDSKDALTGLPDRVAFEEAFQRIRTLYGACDQPLSIAVIDLDDFEQITDLYGQSAGDRVLRRSADLIARSLRSSDILARWDGHEFALLFPHALASEADEILYRAQQSVRHERFAFPSGTDFRISFSAGICEVRPEEPLEDALTRARWFVERSKLAGSGRIHRAGRKENRAEETVLIVEDDKLIAGLLRQRLEREGYTVIHCPSGSQAWQVAQQQTVSLVLLDVRLPGMNGFELLRRLRSMPSYARCPIIMLTGMGSEGDVQQGFALGADDYLLKPFSPIELMARIQCRLGTTGRSRDLHAEGDLVPSDAPQGQG